MAKDVMEVMTDERNAIMKVYVLQGPSGSGKSTLAKELTKNVTNSHICSADNFFMQDGKYNFNAKLLGQAHAWCRGNFHAALCLGADVIVVDNTNTQKREYQPYLDAAIDAGYEAEVVRVGELDDDSLKLYANRNKHKVPLDVIRKQAARIERDK